MKTIEDIRHEYERYSQPPDDADKDWYQERGRNFEKMLNQLLAISNLNPRLRYRPSGEEIDGSFIHNGRIYLLEAKWTKAPIPASSLYEFKGKVDGKLVGTLGAFVSIGGYSQDAEKALSYGKQINLILFDKDDFEECLNSESQFSSILEAKLRIAAEYGLSYVTFDQIKPITQADTEGINIVLCPSSKDAIFTNFLLKHFNTAFNTKVVSAHGQSMEIYAEFFRNIQEISKIGIRKFIAIIDGESSPSEVGALRNSLSQIFPASVKFTIIEVSPSIEKWLYPSEHNPFQKLNQNMLASHQLPSEYIRKEIARLKFEDLYNADAEFKQLIDALK